MNECEAPSSSSQEKCSTEEAQLTIEKSSLAARLKRGFYFEDGCYISVQYTVLALIGLGILFSYLIFVYGFNYGVWDPNFRHICNNYNNPHECEITLKL